MILCSIGTLINYREGGTSIAGIGIGDGVGYLSKGQAKSLISIKKFAALRIFLTWFGAGGIFFSSLVETQDRLGGEVVASQANRKLPGGRGRGKGWIAPLFACFLLLPQLAGAYPFVDSLIVASKTFSFGSETVIEIFLYNDSAVFGMSIPLVIKSQTGGAFGRVDSIKMVLPVAYPPAFDLKGVNGTDPDSLFILWVDPYGGYIPGSSQRREAFQLFVTNNANVGVYSLDSNRLSSAKTLKVCHIISLPCLVTFVRGVETILNDPPLLRCSLGRQVYFGASVSLLPDEASDPNGDPLTFSLVSFVKAGGGSPPQYAPVVDSTTGRFFWRSAFDVTELGAWEVTIGVMDPFPRPPVTCSFTIEVADLRGDVNNDGLWSDLVDVLELINAVAFQSPITSENPNAADVNCDGMTDMVDIIDLINFVVFGTPMPCRG